MNDTISVVSTPFRLFLSQNRTLLRCLFAGCLIPFGFAPFHFPGLAILGLALFFNQMLHTQTAKAAARLGFIFGVGYMSVGVSWVYVSIHQYGHLPIFVSILITGIFIAYLSCFFSLLGWMIFRLKYALEPHTTFLCIMQSILLSSLWCLIEYFRSLCLGGFPWLLLGFGQIDSPLRYELPWIGVFGVGFLTCFTACCLIWAIYGKSIKIGWTIFFVLLLTAPALLKNQSSQSSSEKGISVSVIQANLSMRDKWDESLFWSLVEHYQQRIERLLGQTEMIVLPESAIPVPASYLNDWLPDLHRRAQHRQTALLIGLPKSTSRAEVYYYNTLSSFGLAEGSYAKQHLVPFGEFVPKFFQPLMTWLDIPEARMKPGQPNQPLMRVKKHPFASLICYELAYPSLLRQQMPNAEWIVSVSDDGWFGKSFAIYQQLQMAQALSLLTHRYQVVANNDGLSSIIDPNGRVINQLPAFTDGILEGKIYPKQTQTPWTRWGDRPILMFSLIGVLIALFSKRRYPYQSTIL